MGDARRPTLYEPQSVAGVGPGGFRTRSPPETGRGRLGLTEPQSMPRVAGVTDELAEQLAVHGPRLADVALLHVPDHLSERVDRGAMSRLLGWPELHQPVRHGEGQ